MNFQRSNKLRYADVTFISPVDYPAFWLLAADFLNFIAIDVFRQKVLW